MARADAAASAAQPVARRANTAFPASAAPGLRRRTAADMRVRCANALTNASLTHFSIAANRAA
ncbi:hypothetical protein DN523_01380 [Burkholderia multivorans]|nr:hypothetical protein DN470_16680 [Burkholderia multivorans]RAA32745.1 hypothetical protein DN471_02025 [Burkholderia multivorans]RAA33100.1 hypothetical protein DN465_17575 [Burkholderia multivorans]RAA40706.1 hypothetical protein DN472_21900 [Burkholderia multivorans]RAA48240.1 hypothetical protein DN500_08585 [Burkholderia multivorans]